MSKCSYIKLADQSLDYIISLLFLGLELRIQEHVEMMQIVGIVLIVIAIFCKISYEKKYVNLKTDFSPLFLWLLTIERIYTVKDGAQNQSNILLFYMIGFANGQYTSTITIQDMEKTLLIGKFGVQFGMFLTLLIYYYQEPVITNILLIFIIFFVSLHDFRQYQSKQLSEENNDSSFQPSENQSSIQHRLHKIDHTDKIQKHSRKTIFQSVSQNEISFIQIDKQVELQAPSQSINWKKFIEQSEDYICRFTLNCDQLDLQLEQAQKNYSFCKFLQDTKLNLSQFMEEVIVSNELNVSLYDIQNSEQGKQISLYEWINSNLDSQKILEAFKQFKPNQPLYLDENLAVSVPEGYRSIVMIDPFLEKSMSGISAIPLIQGSIEVSNLKNRLILYGKLKNIERAYDFYIQISVFEEEVNGETLQVIALLFRDLEPQVRQIKQNLKNIEKINSTIKFIQQQASMIQQVHKGILQQQNVISETQRSRQITQNAKRTISMSSQKESVDDGLSEVSEKGSKNYQLYQFICKLQYQFLKIQQNNFNYFEVYSINETIQFEKKKVDISQLIHLLFEQFHYDEIVLQQKIKLILNDQNLIDRCIITDTRRLKQLLFNLISNSVKAYRGHEDFQRAKNIEILLQGYEDTICIEIADYGCGISEENLRGKRLQECKLGFAASQKLLSQLGSGVKQFKVISYKSLHKTIVRFELPTVLIIDKVVVLGDEFDFDSIQFSNS